MYAIWINQIEFVGKKAYFFPKAPTLLYSEGKVENFYYSDYLFIRS